MELSSSFGGKGRGRTYTAGPVCERLASVCGSVIQADPCPEMDNVKNMSHLCPLL